MTTPSAKARHAQLGMPFGTAMGRLRKILIFNLLVRHSENTCFKCGNKIETVEELSVEHKKPWLHISADLFWDVDNIAWSHLKCNRPDRPYVLTDANKEALRKIGPEGTSWCTKHQEFLPLEKFTKDKGRWSGINNLCKEHSHYWRVPRCKISRTTKHGTISGYNYHKCRCEECSLAMSTYYKNRKNKS